MLNFNLSGKRALVCGASQGLGAAAAYALAELGCEITALARNKTALTHLITTLPHEHHQQHRYCGTDVSDHEHLAQIIGDEIKCNGNFDILINNSGGPNPGPIEKATAAEFQQAFNQHLQTNVLLTSLLLPYMKEKKYGRIINIISTSVKSPIDNLGVSNTIRASVAAWAKTLSYEVAKFGVTVNSVLPGFIATSRLEQLITELARARQVSTDTIRQEIIASIPAGRLGTPQEIGAAIAFLATPAASYINGIAMPIDGGRTKVL